MDELGAGEAAALGYELIVVDEEEDGSAPSEQTMDARTAVSLARSGPAGEAVKQRPGRRRFRAPAAKVKVSPRSPAGTPARDVPGRPGALVPGIARVVGAHDRIVDLGPDLDILRPKGGVT